MSPGKQAKSSNSLNKNKTVYESSLQQSYFSAVYGGDSMLSTNPVEGRRSSSFIFVEHAADDLNQSAEAMWPYRAGTTTIRPTESCYPKDEEIRPWLVPL